MNLWTELFTDRASPSLGETKALQAKLKPFISHCTAYISLKCIYGDDNYNHFVLYVYFAKVLMD
jgi:hypothetical protein